MGTTDTGVGDTHDSSVADTTVAGTGAAAPKRHWMRSPPGKNPAPRTATVVPPCVVPVAGATAVTRGGSW